jgi:hypothetical protein
MEEDNLRHLERFEHLAPEPSYIAGFIDGDGCIFIRKIKDGYQTGISVSQSRTNILQVLRYHFGGSIVDSHVKNRVDGNRRNEYCLFIRSYEYDEIINYIKDSVVIKVPQMNSLSSFSKLANRPGFETEKQALYETCSTFNQTKNIPSEQLKLDRINYAYVAGLFDAEGCICIRRRETKYDWFISITQKSYPAVITHLISFLGFGSINEGFRFKIYKTSNCLQFLSIVKPFCIVKLKQIELFEEFLTCNNLNLQKEIFEEISREKHDNETFLKTNTSNEGKEMFFYKQQLKQNFNNVLSQLVASVIEKPVLKKRKSREAATEETKKKMSTAIRDAKGGVSDETIFRVRELFASGKSIEEVMDELSLQRFTVSRIKNGDIVCRSETKAKKISTAEERNIQKRKIKLDEIMYVVDKTLDDKSTPSDILEKIVNKRKRYNEENTVTIDIIKNIRRKLTSNELPFYESEVDMSTYNYYFEKLNKFNKI